MVSRTGRYLRDVYKVNGQGELRNSSGQNEAEETGHLRAVRDLVLAPLALKDLMATGTTQGGLLGR